MVIVLCLVLVEPLLTSICDTAFPDIYISDYGVIQEQKRAAFLCQIPIHHSFLYQRSLLRCREKWHAVHLLIWPEVSLARVLYWGGCAVIGCQMYPMLYHRKMDGGGELQEMQYSAIFSRSLCSFFNFIYLIFLCHWHSDLLALGVFAWRGVKILCMLTCP